MGCAEGDGECVVEAEYRYAELASELARHTERHNLKQDQKVLSSYEFERYEIGLLPVLNLRIPRVDQKQLMIPVQLIWFPVAVYILYSDLALLDSL